MFFMQSSHSYRFFVEKVRPLSDNPKNPLRTPPYIFICLLRITIFIFLIKSGGAQNSAVNSAVICTEIVHIYLAFNGQKLYNILIISRSVFKRLVYEKARMCQK